MKFKKVYIEITNHCNLSCPFCSHDIRAKRWMSVEEFSHILKEVKPYTKTIYLHVKGEPLLHPNIIEFIKIANKYKAVILLCLCKSFSSLIMLIPQMYHNHEAMVNSP